MPCLSKVASPSSSIKLSATSQPDGSKLSSSNQNLNILEILTLDSIQHHCTFLPQTG